MTIHAHDKQVKTEPSETTKNTPRARHYSAPQLISLESSTEIQGGTPNLSEGNDGVLS